MAAKGDLIRSLEIVREAATQVLQASGNEEVMEAFCSVIHRQLSTIAEDYDLAAHDSLRLKISFTIEASLHKLATVRTLSADDRARLGVSFARSVRADLDKLIPVLRA